MKVSIAVDSFYDYKLCIRGVAATSAKTYACHLGKMKAALGPDRRLAVGARRLEPYLADLGRRGLSEDYRSQAFSLARQFTRWASQRGHLHRDPLCELRAPIVRRKRRIFLTHELVQDLLSVVYRSGGIHAHRDHALLSCCYWAMLRVSEATGLRPEDLDLERRELRILGKGSKPATLPIVADLERILRAWIRELPAGAPYLFPSQAAGHERMGRLDACRVEDVLRERYAPLAGLAGRVTPHTLRRSASNNLMRAGVEIGKIRDLLRHSSERTTREHYIDEEAPDELRRALSVLGRRGPSKGL